MTSGITFSLTFCLTFNGGFSVTFVSLSVDHSLIGKMPMHGNKKITGYPEITSQVRFFCLVFSFLVFSGLVLSYPNEKKQNASFHNNCYESITIVL